MERTGVLPFAITQGNLVPITCHSNPAHPNCPQVELTMLGKIFRMLHAEQHLSPGSGDTWDILHLEKLLLMGSTLVSSRTMWDQTTWFAQDEGFLFCQAYVSLLMKSAPLCHFVTEPKRSPSD